MHRRGKIAIVLVLLVAAVTAAAALDVEMRSISAFFTDLEDTPDDYTGAAGQCVTVNSTEDGLNYSVCGGGGGESILTKNADVVYIMPEHPQDFMVNDKILMNNSGNISYNNDLGNTVFSMYTNNVNGYIESLVNSFFIRDMTTLYLDPVSSLHMDVNSFTFGDGSSSYVTTVWDASGADSIMRWNESAYEFFNDIFVNSGNVIASYFEGDGSRLTNVSKFERSSELIIFPYRSGGTGYFNDPTNTMACTSSICYEAHRDGSIVGLQLITAYTCDSLSLQNCKIEVRKNGVAIDNIFYNKFGGGGALNKKETYDYGTYNFSAGDEIACYGSESGMIMSHRVGCTVEIAYEAIE